MYHIFFIHSSVDGHLGYFRVLTILNSAAMNRGCSVFFILGVPGLPCCTHAFSLCCDWGLPFIAVPGRLIAVACLVAEFRLSNVAHRVSFLMACGIILDQGLNPRPLHWQVDS